MEEKWAQSDHTGTILESYRLPCLHPTYQLREHFLHLIHFHNIQVLCLGLPDSTDSSLWWNVKK